MRTKNRFREITGALVLMGLGASARAAERAPLNRSLYVPVRLSLCPHLSNAVLYLGDQALGVLPGERIFQFTYYPALKRLEPRAQRIRVEGIRHLGGLPFRTELLITPEAIVTASKRIALPVGAELAKLRHRLDVRYQSVLVRLQCELESATEVADGAFPES